MRQFLQHGALFLLAEGLNVLEKYGEALKELLLLPSSVLLNFSTSDYLFYNFIYLLFFFLLTVYEDNVLLGHEGIRLESSGLLLFWWPPRLNHPTPRRQWNIWQKTSSVRSCYTCILKKCFVCYSVISRLLDVKVWSFSEMW